jgi:DNA-binding NtrC family response regulator
MKTPTILLLTNDPKLEDCVAHVLQQSGGLSHLAHSAGDALQVVCGTGHELNLAVIDFESGPHGMTLLSAMSMCREELPLIVIMHEDQQHVEPLAHANGAVACFSKPVAAEQLAEVFQQCCRRRDSLALVAA